MSDIASAAAVVMAFLFLAVACGYALGSIDRHDRILTACEAEAVHAMTAADWVALPSQELDQ